MNLVTGSGYATYRIYFVYNLIKTFKLQEKPEAFQKEHPPPEYEISSVFFFMAILAVVDPLTHLNHDPIRISLR
jgi:hypothetical protein